MRVPRLGPESIDHRPPRPGASAARALYCPTPGETRPFRDDRCTPAPCRLVTLTPYQVWGPGSRILRLRGLKAADFSATRRIADEVRTLVARLLTKVYRVGEVEVHALRGTDFEMHPGEFVVLLGSSGSGKSTPLNMLGGRDVPTARIVCCLAHDLTAPGEAALTRYRREHVGFVFKFY